MWSDEQKYFVNEPYPRCSTTGDKGDVGHYTQMVWQDTTEVGCGFASGFGRDYLVCQYDPAGNKNRQYAYDETETEVDPETTEEPTEVQPSQVPTSYVPTPEFVTPVDITQIQNPVQIPQVQTPQVQTPQVQTSQSQTSQAQNSQSQTSQSQTSQAQSSQVKTTSSESDPFISRCLELHNDERALFNIPGLTWNADLAETALAWAKQLASKGSLSHSSGRVHIGENVSYTGTKANSIDRLIGMWLDEKKYFVYKPYPDCSNSGDSSDVGHYTQLIWKDTTELGCGLSTKSGKDFLVCQYKTSGNRIGKYAY